VQDGNRNRGPFDEEGREQGQNGSGQSDGSHKVATGVIAVEC
jgi:hypothetical protein